MVPSPPNDIFQFSTLAAHTSGFLSGQPHTRDLTSHGTHGIGIYEDSSLMILLDRTASSIRNDGTAVPAPLDDKLPFAMVTMFQPTYRLNLPSLSLEELVDVLEAPDLGVARGVNTFLPFEIRTKFSSVSLEQGGSLQGVEGTIFGYVVPKWMREISGPRIHAHFLNEEESRGGRLEGFEVEGEVQVGFGKCGRFHLGFPQGEGWEDVRLSRT